MSEDSVNDEARIRKQIQFYRKMFWIVKAAYATDELEVLLDDLGWTARVTLLSPSAHVLQGVSGVRR